MEGLMFYLGHHLKKYNTECFTFGNFTKALDHLSPILGPAPGYGKRKTPNPKFKVNPFQDTHQIWKFRGRSAPGGKRREGKGKERYRGGSRS